MNREKSNCSRVANNSPLFGSQSDSHTKLCNSAAARSMKMRTRNGISSDSAMTLAFPKPVWIFASAKSCCASS